MCELYCSISLKQNNNRIIDHRYSTCDTSIPLLLPPLPSFHRLHNRRTTHRHRSTRPPPHRMRRRHHAECGLLPPHPSARTVTTLTIPPLLHNRHPHRQR